MGPPQRDLDTLCINTVRTLCIDAVQAANSGHPGLPLGAAPMAYVLWQRHLRHAPTNPAWPNRDRFVLSAGHGSMLLYALLHLTGYGLPLAELKKFRQWGSRTPGHPESFVTRGVEATTGPLGQGAGNAVGMAVAERYLAALFNRPSFPVVDHRTYALVSDGDLMEGVVAEAASLAGHLRLGKLTFLYDANLVSLDGPTSLAFDEDVPARFAAYGWQVLHVGDGDHDLAAIDAALAAARAETARPTLIVVRTTIGFGSPNKAGTSASHGSPLGAEEVARTKQALGWDPAAHFHVPAEAAAHLAAARGRGEAAEAEWEALMARYTAAHPALAAQFAQARAGTLPDGWDGALPEFAPGSLLATREASGKVLNAIAARVPHLIGGDADLSVSTLTDIKGAAAFGDGAGRNIHFGVREHAMGAIANGMAYHGGTHPYVSTFFVFSDYMRPAVRLAALSGLPVTFVWTHDSIGLGEDGPTHQPIEQLASLRAMPHLTVLRPADARETAAAWQFAMRHRGGPCALVLSRQKLPTLDCAALGSTMAVARGAYVLSDPPQGAPRAILLATGAEVHVALAASARLAREGVATRVVSMPSWELFAAQDAAYRAAVLPPAVTARVSVEAASTLGWERWTGSAGRTIGLDRFGASAPAEVVFAELGITEAHVAAAVREVLGGAPAA